MEARWLPDRSALQQAGVAAWPAVPSGVQSALVQAVPGGALLVVLAERPRCVCVCGTVRRHRIRIFKQLVNETNNYIIWKQVQSHLYGTRTCSCTRYCINFTITLFATHAIPWLHSRALSGKDQQWVAAVAAKLGAALQLAAA
jgi:hypothetical protein